MLQRHRLGYPERASNLIPILPNPGDIHWRRNGDTHMWDPTSISNLQVAAKTNDNDAYRQFADHADGEATKKATFRGLLSFKQDVNGGSIDISEVESAKEIVKRFLHRRDELWLRFQPEAHESLAIAMNRLGGKSNTGEGGEGPDQIPTNGRW